MRLLPRRLLIGLCTLAPRTHCDGEPRRTDTTAEACLWHASRMLACAHPGSRTYAGRSESPRVTGQMRQHGSANSIIMSTNMPMPTNCCAWAGEGRRSGTMGASRVVCGGVVRVRSGGCVLTRLARRVCHDHTDTLHALHDGACQRMTLPEVWVYGQSIGRAATEQQRQTPSIPTDVVVHRVATPNRVRAERVKKV